MQVTQMPLVHAGNLVANSGNTAYRVDEISNHSLKIELLGNNTATWIVNLESSGECYLY